jgi:hypothetical protein
VATFHYQPKTPLSPHSNLPPTHPDIPPQYIAKHIHTLGALLLAIYPTLIFKPKTEGGQPPVHLALLVAPFSF